MELTIEFLAKKFKEFNKEFFNNELPMIQLNICRSRKLFGCYRYKRVGSTEQPLMISISKYYNCTKKEICETLIHEMIHYYLSYKKLGRHENAHGYQFLKKMIEINSKSNYNITTIGSSKGKVSIYAKRGKKHTILLFKYNGINYFSKVTGQMKNAETIKERFSDIEIIKFVTTTSQAAEMLIARTSKLSLIPATPDNLKKYSIAA